MTEPELAKPEPIEPTPPKAGDFYYHYKHNPELDLMNFCYMVIGTAIHTETEEILIIYKPVYRTDFLKEKRADFFACSSLHNAPNPQSRSFPRVSPTTATR